VAIVVQFIHAVGEVRRCEQPRKKPWGPCVFASPQGFLRLERYRRLVAVKTLKVKWFPNNEVRICMYPARRLRNSEEVDRLVALTSGSGGDPGQEVQTPSLSPLTLVPNSEPGRIRPGWGTLGRETQFGLNARRTMVRAGGVAEADGHNPGEWLFLTGTLPGGTPEAMRALAEWSSALIDRLKSWISKHELATESMYCWEFQGRGALHLHYCVRIKGGEANHRILDGFSDWWISAIERISSDSSTDCFEWANRKGSWRGRKEVIQSVAIRCEKPPSRYLSKYLSKGAIKREKKIAKKAKNLFYPVRWWGVSRPLLRRLRELTKEWEVPIVQWFDVRKKVDAIDVAIRGFYDMAKKGDRRDPESELGIAYKYQDKSGMCTIWALYGLPEGLEGVENLVSLFIESKQTIINYLNRVVWPRDCTPEKPRWNPVLRSFGIIDFEAPEWGYSRNESNKKCQTLLQLDIEFQGLGQSTCLQT